MALVRTNVTLPKETLDLVDAVAGPRGRSRYIADVVSRQVRRDHARDVFQRYAGALKESTSWGRTDEEVDEYFRRLRAEWDDRLERLWAPEGVDAVPAGLDAVHRPSRRSPGSRGARRVSVQRAE
jgi:Ribonuclease G/E